MICNNHTSHFEDSCDQCKIEYFSLKGLVKSNDSVYSVERNSHVQSNSFKYKEFSEEKAKDLYQKLFLYYIKKTTTESEASKRAKKIIKLQCLKRQITPWSWLD